MSRLAPTIIGVSLLVLHRYDFLPIPITDINKMLKPIKHNRSDIISKSLLFCKSHQNEVGDVPQVKGFIIC